MEKRAVSPSTLLQQTGAGRGSSRLAEREAAELHLRWQRTKDVQSKNYLDRAIRRYAISIALMYCRYGFRLSDLIVEGELGAKQALESYDPDKDHRILAYVAYWIRMFILDHVLHASGAIELDSAAWGPKPSYLFRRERVRIAQLIGEHHDTGQRFAERFKSRAAGRDITATNAVMLSTGVASAPIGCAGAP
jgi:RNA polymerase sigma-32 factor